MITAIDTRKAVEFFDAKLEFTTGPVELNGMIEKREEINIVDVRREQDYRQGHIPGAINLPREKWDSFVGLSTYRTNIVYCYHQQCHLAAQACKVFAEHGYPVMELEGGIDAWRKNDFRIEK
jgi:rhodanese-related sulfurtransferase